MACMLARKLLIWQEMKPNFWAGLLGLLWFVPVAHAQGVVQWGWRFNSTDFYLQPHDGAEVTATVYVKADSPQSLMILGTGGAFAGDFQKTYAFVFGHTGSDFGTELIGKTISPGQTVQLFFGSLSPILPPINLGDYPADPALINFNTNIGPTGGIQPDNSFVVHVVPEPGILGLFLLASVLLAVSGFTSGFHRPRGFYRGPAFLRDDRGGT